jgi:hypothetical protein
MSDKDFNVEIEGPDIFSWLEMVQATSDFLFRWQPSPNEGGGNDHDRRPFCDTKSKY